MRGVRHTLNGAVIFDDATHRLALVAKTEMRTLVSCKSKEVALRVTDVRAVWREGWRSTCDPFFTPDSTSLFLFPNPHDLFLDSSCTLVIQIQISLSVGSFDPLQSLRNLGLLGKRSIASSHRA